MPNVAEMTDFNMWTFNARVFPGIDVMPVRLGDRVRIRMGNLTMTNHPIHLHGHDFRVTMTDGGWMPETAQMPEATTDVPVGTVRALEFVADAPGDWAFHCHKSHHTMNAMGHKVKNFIGVPESALSQALDRAAPTAMAMGTSGMADMAEMGMPLPANTLPMMTGTGPFGGIEMGGMFTLVKVREGLAANDYRIPAGTSIPKAPWPTRSMPAQAGEPPRQTGEARPAEDEMPADADGPLASSLRDKRSHAAKFCRANVRNAGRTLLARIGVLLIVFHELRARP